MKLRREGPARRAMLLVGAIVVTLGIVGAGIPSVAAGAGVSPAPSDPAPSDPAPSDPVPTDPPDPIPSEPAPTDPTNPSPSDPPTSEPTPSDPAPSNPTPTQPGPSMPPGPGPVAPVPSSPGPFPVPWAPTPSIDRPFVSGAPPVTPPPSSAVPAALGLVYPTNPWIYNDLPGTRYLDERERDGGRVVRRHLGIDAQGGFRQPIFAVAAGTVVGGTWGTTSRDRHGFGNQVEIAHIDGYATRYAHLAEAPIVQPGDQVAAGQLIGYMGGSQYGDLSALARHLHFEVTKDGANVDPLAFLSGASATIQATAAVAASGSLLYEMRSGADGAYGSVSTGLKVNSNVFTAVDMGGVSAQIMVSDGGTLKQLAVVGGVWTTVDTHLALNATSISGASTGTGFPELFAVEDGKLFHIVGAASGWTKTWTGHYFSGTVSAVRMPGERLHAMLQQAGYLYHLYPAQGGRWNIADTRLEVGDRIDAVYAGGRAPDVMAVIDGQVHRITRGEVAWDAVSTGLPASGALAAVNQDGGWPIALTADPGTIGMTLVVDRMWTRYAYDLTAPGPIDAVEISGVGPVLYSIG